MKSKHPLAAFAAASLSAFAAFAVAGFAPAASAQTESAESAAAAGEESEAPLSPDEFDRRVGKDALDRAFGLSEMLILPAKLSVVIGRGESLYVRNQSSDSRDFRVVAAPPSDDEDFEDGRDFVRYGPRQFTLLPEETQVVRIFARRPPDDGKPRRMRLSVRLLPIAPPLPDVGADEIRASFSAIYAVSVPIDLID